MIYRNYKIAVVEFAYTSAISDNCPLCAFLPPNRLGTRAQVSHLAPLVPLVSTALVPLLPDISRILDSDPYRGPGLYILFTTLLHALLIGVPYPTSNSTFPSIGSIAMHGFVWLPTSDLVSVSHATSSPFPMFLPGLRASTVTAPSSGVVSKTPQNKCSVAHLSVSY